ncbi:MAG: hypothetical protein KKH44_07380 [Bacteroidetes bacterium]|nr:hypothetical protein [Bacteroidota bacterium]
MSLSKKEVLKLIERAEEIYKANQYMQLQTVIVTIQDNIDILGDDNAAVYARYYRIYMLYIGAFEELNMPVLHSYLVALENCREVQASDYEYVCSYYKECENEVYENALMQFPYNENLHVYYALKLQEDKRYDEAIVILKYILECYPALTEARFLLWEVEAAQLEKLTNSNEEVDRHQLLDLASATHNLTFLKELQVDDRLDLASKDHARIQISLWEARSVENKNLWKTEWKSLKLANRTRLLIADYAASFMMYDIVSQILKAPSKPQFPEEQYSNFDQYKAYMQELANSGWQLAQHHYLLLGNAANYHTQNNQALQTCVEQGLALNPKNPLLLVLKAKSLFRKAKYSECGAAYHEAYRNGLRMSEYLFYLLEVNSRIESWQGILDIVAQFHRRQSPTLKTMFFKARALVKLQRFDEALEVINESLSDFPLPAHSYAPWIYNLRMIIHKVNLDYTAFFEDMQEEINYYQEGDSDYCSTINLCVEALLEMGDYQECYKYTIYNHEQGHLPEELKPVLQWLCFYEYIPKPEDLNSATEEDLIAEPSTFLDFRNNGLIHWMLRNHSAGAACLIQAAEMASNKGYYLKLALACSKESFIAAPSIEICETIKREAPEASDWQLDYDYAELLYDDKRYMESLIAYQNMLQNYPDYSFEHFPKDENHMMLRRLKFISKDLSNSEAYIKYNAMFLSKEEPSEVALLDQVTAANTYFKEDVYLQHNLLERITKLDIEFENNEIEALSEIKTRIRNTSFV